MAADHHPNIRIVGVPTVRDSDGVALSSRNRFLTAEERETAPLIPAALENIVAAGGSADSVALARETLDQSDVVVDYLAVIHPETLERAKPHGPARVIVAARIGTTRLIDNMRVRD
jgi:pantoate--beta-alanine ligase